ncbi:MAG: metallophosphoesterase family protein [Clostridiaceae bacterium]|nr:metallophosphoesterase family protein [Clostridiaceae bacterium]
MINNSCRRIALLADIHGNDTAFEAVVDDAAARGASDYVICGDLISDWPQSTEVIKRTEKLTHNVVAGNRDNMAVTYEEIKGSLHLRQFAALRHVYEHLSVSEIGYLQLLPSEIELKIGQFTLLASHHSPSNQYRCFHPDINRETVAETMRAIPQDIYVCGHVHFPSCVSFGQKLFINPGSVGVNASGAFVADYALLTEDNGSIDVRHISVPYQGKLLLNTLAKSGMCDCFDTAFWMALVLTMQTYPGQKAGSEFLHLLFKHAKDVKREHGIDCGDIPDSLWECVCRSFLIKYNIDTDCFCEPLRKALS